MIDEAFVTETARDLVRIESVNPSLDPGGSGEEEIADHTADLLERLGLEVQRDEPEPGRPSVIGRLPGRGDGPSLMLNAHYDTVGVEGMEAPFAAEVRDGKLFGRGAYDMKGSLAACLGAVRALREGGVALAGDLWITAVADEEHASLGTRALLERWAPGERPDAAVVTEPTGLRPCVAHKGFVWMEVSTRGRAAHGSKPELGVDANLRMGHVLSEIARLVDELAARPVHPLLGPPSLHVGTLRGGSGISTYAAACRLELERRTLPGETGEQVLAEVRDALDRARERHGFEPELEHRLTRAPFETDADAPVARALRDSLSAMGLDAEPTGETPWMDSALLAEAGIDTVVVGPSGQGAHAAEEWVDLGSLARLAEVLVRTSTAYCGDRGRPPPDTSGRRGS